MRKTEILDRNWRFHRGDVSGGERFCLNDSAWSLVDVPHDWAVEGPFARENDLQITRIVADGEERAEEHVGRTGSLPHTGIGWYRREFFVPKTDLRKNFRLEFDGVMSHATVYVNGKKAGYRAYGYSSFEVDATAFIRGGKNVVAVCVNNPPDSSRWYPGAGIYREVRLITLEPVHFLYSGVWISTAELNRNDRVATLKIHTELSVKPTDDIELEIDVTDPNGEMILSENFAAPETFLCIPDVELWSPADPKQYRIRIMLMKNETWRDQIEIACGIREVRFDADKGMTLNGQPFRMNGVCLHHDFGPLGAAFSLPSLVHRFKLLKDIGCNAVRTSHNPPDPKLLDLCDSMGFVVLDEAFDCWRAEKILRDYHVDFDEWHKRDLTDLIRRDRNHTSVVMWSIGNEVIEQYREDGAVLTRELTALCHEVDPTRPVTCGFSFVGDERKGNFGSGGAIANHMVEEVDIPGWNYKPQLYPSFHERYPTMPQYGSETSSTVSSRGEYKFPVVEGYHFYDNGQCSSYDLEFPPWATTPDKEFHFQDACPWIMGEFVWTGFDYLGEPTPYNSHWPSHSSCFGIFDLAGLPKDRAWLYAARWSGKNVLHILPHWNWNGREGEKTPVHVYTSYSKVELFVNGVSMGMKTRGEAYRLVWDDVVYQPGEIVAVAMDGQGNELDRVSRKTAGDAVRLALEPDRDYMKADGKDLIFITVSMLDADGTPLPLAQNSVSFEISGPGTLAGVANGDPRSTELFTGSSISLFNGQAMVIVKSHRSPGDLLVTAVCPGVKSCSLALSSL